MNRKKSKLLIPMLWVATGFAGAASVLRLVQNARINGGWYGSEGSAIIWGLYTLLALINTTVS